MAMPRDTKFQRESQLRSRLVERSGVVNVLEETDRLSSGLTGIQALQPSLAVILWPLNRRPLPLVALH
jgi:hypothetical protein